MAMWIPKEGMENYSPVVQALVEIVQLQDRNDFHDNGNPDLAIAEYITAGKGKPYKNLWSIPSVVPNKLMRQQFEIIRNNITAAELPYLRNMLTLLRLYEFDYEWHLAESIVADMFANDMSTILLDCYRDNMAELYEMAGGINNPEAYGLGHVSMDKEIFCKKYKLTEAQFEGRELIERIFTIHEKSIPAGFNPVVIGHLFLNEVQSLPAGFNPIVSGALSLSRIEILPEDFHPVVGDDLVLSYVDSLPKGFAPVVCRDLILSSLESLPEEFSLTVGNDLDLESIDCLPEDCHIIAGGGISFGGDYQSINAEEAELSWQNGKYRIFDGVLYEIITEHEDSTLEAMNIVHERKFFFGADGTCLTTLPKSLDLDGNSGLDLGRLESLPEGFDLNQTIEGDLDLHSLTSLAKGFKLIIKGNLNLSSLTTLPEDFKPIVCGSLRLNSLTSLPEGFSPIVGEHLTLSSLTDLSAGFNPIIGGSLDLCNVTTLPEDFKLTVGSTIYLQSLKTLPTGFNPITGGSIRLDSLTSLPEGFEPIVRYNIGLNKQISLPADFRFKAKDNNDDSYNKYHIGAQAVSSLLSWQNGRYRKIDNIFCEIISTDGNIMKAKRCDNTCNVDTDYATGYFYIATDGTSFAHGATIEEAQEEL